MIAISLTSRGGRIHHTTADKIDVHAHKTGEKEVTLLFSGAGEARASASLPRDLAVALWLALGTELGLRPTPSSTETDG